MRVSQPWQSTEMVAVSVAVPKTVSVRPPLLQLAVVVEVVLQCVRAAAEAMKRVKMLGKRIEECMVAGLCDDRRDRVRCLWVFGGGEFDCLGGVWSRPGKRLFICKTCRSRTE